MHYHFQLSYLQSQLLNNYHNQFIWPRNINQFCKYYFEKHLIIFLLHLILLNFLIMIQMLNLKKLLKLIMLVMKYQKLSKII